MKKAFLTIVALATALVACRKSEAPEAVPADPSAVRFTTNIRTYTVKATDTAFETGDKVGIYAGDPIGKTNVVASVADNMLNHNSSIKWNKESDAEVVFAAYYPYLETPGESFTVQADQSTQAAYKGSDLMLAKVSSKPVETALPLNFSHALSKVVLVVENKVPETTVTGVRVEDVALSTAVNYQTATLGAAQESAGNITPLPITGGYQFVLVPQSSKLKVRVSLSNGRDYIFELAEPFIFRSGYKVEGTLTVVPLQEENSTEFDVDIDDWDEEDDPLGYGEPQQELPVWSIRGLGGKWDVADAVKMARTTAGKEAWEGVWEADITYAQGDVFKLSWNNGWEKQAGMNPGWNFYGLGDFESNDDYLWGEGGDDIVLGTGYLDEEVVYPAAGEYHVKFIYDSYKLIVTAKE